LIAFMMWSWLSTTIVLMGGDLNAEIEHQTAKDSTTGRPKPLGKRGPRWRIRLARHRARAAHPSHFAFQLAVWPKTVLPLGNRGLGAAMSWISRKGIAAGGLVAAALLAVLLGAAWLWAQWWTADQKSFGAPPLALVVPYLLATITPFMVAGHVVSTIAVRMKMANVVLAGACYAILGVILQALLRGNISAEDRMGWALLGAFTVLGCALGLGIAKLARRFRRR
jgi:hypothetical protein